MKEELVRKDDTFMKYHKRYKFYNCLIIIGVVLFLISAIFITVVAPYYHNGLFIGYIVNATAIITLFIGAILMRKLPTDFCLKCGKNYVFDNDIQYEYEEKKNKQEVSITIHYQCSSCNSKRSIKKKLAIDSSKNVPLQVKEFVKEQVDKQASLD